MATPIVRYAGEGMRADLLDVPCDCGNCAWGDECAYDAGPDPKPLTTTAPFKSDEAKRLMLRAYGIENIDGWLLAEQAALMVRKDAA